MVLGLSIGFVNHPADKDPVDGDVLITIDGMPMRALEKQGLRKLRQSVWTSLNSSE